MKHLKLFFALFAMLALGVGNAWAEEETLACPKGTISNNTMTWDLTSCTVVHAKGTNNNYAEYSPWRIYQGAIVTFTPKANTTISQIVITAGSTAYATAGKTTWTNASASASGSTITVTPTDGTKDISITASAQTRWSNIVITYTTAGGETPDPTPTTQYTVKWYTALGTSTDVTLDEGAAITKPATDPTMSGYEFMGWTDQCSVAEDGTGFTALTDFGTADADKEFYAVFAVVTTTGGGGSATETTATVSISNYASANSWSDATKYTSVTIDANITATVTGGGNTGKYYNNGTNWRLYQNETPSLTLTAAEGYTIKTAKVTYSVSNTGVLTLNSANVTSGTVSTINAASVSYGVGNTGTATNGQVRVTAIEVVYTSGSASVTTYSDYKTTCSGATVVETLTDAQFAWSAATAEATMGATNTFPTLTNTVPVSVTYESSNTAAATIVADGTITLVAPGATTISAKFAGGEVSGTTYAAKTVTYNLTVLKAPAVATGTVYVKVTSTAGITDGEYLIVYETGKVAFDGSLTSLDATKNTIDVEINNNTIAGTNYIDLSTFTIDATAGTIKSKSGYYIGKTATGNGLNTNQSTKYTNTITIDANKNAVVTSSGGPILRYNKAADQLRFRYFGSGQEAIALYKKASSHTLTYGTCTNGSVSADVADGATVLSGTTITLNNEPIAGYKLSAYDVYKTDDATVKVTVADGKFVMPEYDVTISATFEAAKTLTSIEITTAATQTTFWQNETFNSTGLVVTAHFDGAADEVVTPTVTGSTATAGTQTVTVSFTEGTTTKTATYTIEVKAIPNTKETAYSVADAYDIIDKLTTAEGVFITGTISQVDSYNSTYKSITYWISADGTTTNQLQAYSGKGLESADFAAVTDLTVGDKVIVCGDLKKYNSTYEFDKNNYLAEYTPTTKDPAGLEYATTEYTANVGEAFATPTLTNPNNLTVTYSTSDASKATVDASTGEVTILAVGKVTITASTTGDATHDAGTASYTITISDPALAIATLPFTYNSGKAAIETTAGITHSGLGSDYTADGVPPLKFDTEGDNVIVHYDQQAGEFSFVLKQNGQTAGTFTVYESANGEDYTPVWTGGDLGNAQSATITPTLAAASRYVKFEYTTKPSGTNYGLGSISIQKPDLRQEAGIAWSAETTTITIGDAFTAPTLSNPNGLTLTCTSDNENLATVTNAGVITLKEGVTGKAVITASFAGNEDYKSAEVTTTIIVSPETGDVVILAKHQGQWYAMKAEYVTDKTDRLAAVAVNYVGGKLYNVSEEDKAAITWTRSVYGDKVSFQNDGKYLKGKTSTTLILEANEDGLYQWNADDNTMLIGETSRTFIYHRDGMFRNYGVQWASPTSETYSDFPVVTAPVYATAIEINGGDNSIVIGTNKDQTVNVIVDRSFEEGDEWYTLCVPFNMPASVIGKAYQISGLVQKTADYVEVYLAEKTTIVAGEPYLIKPTVTVDKFVVENVTIVNTQGTSISKSISGLSVTMQGVINGNGTTDGLYWVGNGGLLYNDPASKSGLRAYFNITTSSGIAPRMRVVAGENVETGVEDIITTDAPVKVIENGQLIIIRDGVKYNVQGQKL